jgi:hypothetical protein
MRRRQSDWNASSSVRTDASERKNQKAWLVKYLFHFVLETSRAIPTGAAGFSITIDGTKAAIVAARAGIAANRHERIHQPDGFHHCGR